MHDKITSSLSEQNIFHIFYELFKLESLTDKEDKITNEYVGRKFVTIIEQFCRKITEIQLQDGSIRKPIPKNELNVKNFQNIKAVNLFLKKHIPNFQPLENISIWKKYLRKGMIILILY